MEEFQVRRRPPPASFKFIKFLTFSVKTIMPSSVTRLDDLLLFEQLFKARGNNYFAQIANTI